MSEKLVYESSIEGLFLKGLGNKVTPALRDDLKGLGIDLGRIPKSVSRETWAAALDATARHLYPSLERKAALKQLGIVLMKGVEESFLGRTMARMVKFLGVKRLIERVPENMKSSNNFSSASVTSLSGNACRLDVNDIGDTPEVFQGSLEEMARWAGAKTVDVKFELPNPPAASFVIRWT